ncbi:hypothetical protein I3843_14G013900 [Carya illinoinensis]|nr:hypothetical protein I3843_14G013900 [Carya illinoinensis]
MTPNSSVMINFIGKQLHIWKMVEVRVPNLDCEGCASKLKKALFKLKVLYL